MFDPGLIRTACLMGPALAALGVASARPPDRRAVAAAIIGFAWNLPILFALNLVAVAQGWWSFEAEGGLLLGIPVDLMIGWAILWGVLPVWTAPSAPTWLVLPVLLGFDLVGMPLCEPVVRLGPDWLIGEAACLAAALVPGHLAGVWTAADRGLAGRALVQAGAFAAWLMWLLPTIVFEQTGGSWSELPERPVWLNSILIQLLMLPIGLGLSAVQEFVTRGTGTPVPLDPPKRLVVSGLYRFSANPMQAAMCLTLAMWSLLLGQPLLAFGSAVGWAFAVGFAQWSEGDDLAGRFGDAWLRWRRRVRPWRWRCRPFVRSRATVYISQTCGLCSPVAAWLAARRPTGLRIVPAEQYASTTRDREGAVHSTPAAHGGTDIPVCPPPRRITYDPGDGTPEQRGVAALARSLEHLHVGWAIVGAYLRLPIVCGAIQILVDACGGGPRTLPPTPTDKT